MALLAYDEREDKTLYPNGKVEKEPHVTFVDGEGNYLNHTTLEYELNPKTGLLQRKTGSNFCHELNEVLEETNSSETLQVIASDGTNSNTGVDKGANRLLEEKLKRPLLWVSLAF